MEIIIQNYTKKIGKATVLSDISLTLEGGRIYGFVGRNGSGKTMLMRAVTGLILPTQGSVSIDGKELGRDISFPPNTGLLLESPGFIPGYSGFQNLKYIAMLQKKIGDAEIRAAMTAVGLDPDEKKSFRKYSLGMKQKLGIAAAMMEDPDLLILDEPFNALDEDTVNKVRDLIRSLRREGRIVILACHDRGEIDLLCDEIVHLKDGKMVERTVNDRAD